MSDDQRPKAGMSWWDKAAIGAMGGVGGALSYDALQQMAVAMHIRPELTYLFPVAIDGFIAYGTRALVVLKEAPLRARAYTWSVFGSATATSVWANWTHAVRLNDLTPPGDGLHLPDWSVGVLSTIAPLVLGGATHLYIVMSRHTSGADADPETASEGQEPSKTSWWSRRGASGQEALAQPAVRTRWWGRKRAEAVALESAASATADEQPELTSVPAPSPVSLTKAPEEPAALPPGPAAASGAQPQAVPVPGTESAAANGTVPGPQTSSATAGSGTVPENGTGAAPGTAPMGQEQKPGTVPGTPPSPGPVSNLSGTAPAVPAESVPLVHAAPPAVPATAAPPAEQVPRHGAGSVPNGSAPSRPGGEASGAGRVNAATATAPHRTPASATTSPSPVPAAPAPADTAAARPRDPGTVPAQPAPLRVVPTPGTANTGTGPEPRPLPVPTKETGPRTGTVETTGAPTVPSGDRPRPGPGTGARPKAVPAAPSPVPGADRGPDREARKRELSEDELEALLPIGRTVAATAEGRLTREALRAGLKAQNVPINNTALGQLLRELKDIADKPPPARR
ncbi:DUF2637 domain-containing protein [Kitasatospora griseola]|uniref:DUF2637 domain-containing protein n=1 Tax=Kitasatospora griseola TaxID=2064 RepID=UPI003829501B